MPACSQVPKQAWNLICGKKAVFLHYDAFQHVNDVVNGSQVSARASASCYLTALPRASIIIGTQAGERKVSLKLKMITFSDLLNEQYHTANLIG
jgi:hypothetical protein